jgi:hypothetical protein
MWPFEVYEEIVMMNALSTEEIVAHRSTKGTNS